MEEIELIEEQKDKLLEMSNALFINSKYDEYDIIDDNETIQDHPSNLEIIKLF